MNAGIIKMSLGQRRRLGKWQCVVKRDIGTTTSGQQRETEHFSSSTSDAI